MNVNRQRRTTRALMATSLTAICALANVLALAPGAAHADTPKLIPYGTFGPTEGGAGVAVDQSSGDVYTAGLFRFGENASGELELVGAGSIEQFNASGKHLSRLGEEGFRAGAAVDPVNKDLYVLNAFGAIETFDPTTGALVSAPFEVVPSANYFGSFTIVQIASDAEGNVYVPVVPENEVLEYSPTGTLLHTFKGAGAGALKEPTGVTVDAAGDLWVADAGNNRIEELSPTGAPLGEIKSEGVRSVARDAKGDVIVLVENSADFCGSFRSPCAHVVEYNSMGSQVADIGAGHFANAVLSMLAVNEASGQVYVTDAETGRLWIFGPPTAPVVDRELTTEVTTNEAKLGALVNPGGIETTYRFEYGTSTAYGQSTPLPEGSVGEGITPDAVWAAASALASGTTYHYRVVAANELGTVYGPDQTFTTETPAQAACPNEEARNGFSLKLPDCRAYELVTASTKTSVQVRPVSEILSFVAARDGNALSFTTREPLPGSPSSGSAYVATRGADGWISEDVIPQESYSAVDCSVYNDKVRAYSDDLSKLVFSYGIGSRASEPSRDWEACNAQGLQVVSGEPVGYSNLLLRDNATQAYQLVNTPDPGLTPIPADAQFDAASADLGHVIFTSLEHLTNDAPYDAENLFEWDEGVVRLVTILPDGEPTVGSLPSVEHVEHTHVVSGDGSHVFFTSGGGLYVRVNGERTLQLDESQGGSGASGGGAFQAAASNGSAAFFLDESRLTADSTAQPGQPDLYECALAEGADRCALSDLTVAHAGESADVIHAWAPGGQDESYIYFLAKGALASNTREYTNAEGQTVVEGAQSGQENLYVWNGKQIVSIATFSNSGEFEPQRHSTISPDGKWYAFDSTKSLTGYDNRGFGEIFLYDAEANRLVCASCDPSGKSLTAGASIAPGTVGGWQRYLADGGRLFFDTSQALLPADTNGQEDVYEYEDGQLHLISSGTSAGKSDFIDASESGDDVFFLTIQQLVPQDTQGEATVIYDARVDGGFPAAAAPPPCVNADACRAPSAPQPSIYGPPSSQTFSGAGNLAPPAGTSSKSNTKPTGKAQKHTCASKRNTRKRAGCEAKRRRKRHTHSVKAHKGGK